MTIIVAEGFAPFPDFNTAIRAKWNMPSQGNFATPGRNGTGRALLLNGSGDTATRPFPPIGPTIIVGTAWKQTSINPVSHALMYFYDQGIIQCSLHQTFPGTLTFRGGTAVFLAVAQDVLYNSSWMYLEVKVTIDNSAGAIIIKVDGKEVMNETGLDTQVSANAQVDSINLRNDPSTDDSWDDFVVMDENGGVNDDFIGEVTVETVFPDADGNRNDFTRFGGGSNNFEAVDDGITPDDDSTYNHSAVVGDDELYGHTALTIPLDNIHALVVRNHVRKEDAGARIVRALCRSNVTEVEGADFGPGFDWRFFDEVYENDPDTAAAWLEAAVNAAEFGFTINA